jgi:hypothetical protein
MNLISFFYLAGLTLFLGYVYRALWHYFSMNSTPKGFGVLMPMILLISLQKISFFEPLSVVLSVIFLFSIIYWLDDLYEINPLFRVALSFISGVSLYLLSIFYGGETFLPSIIGMAVFYGLINVILTNVLNFYDGADLNISLLILLSCLCSLFNPISQGWQHIIFSGIFFIASFSFLNRKPNYLYFGDAGTFAYSSLITSILIFKMQSSLTISLEFFIPFLLPALDVFYVIYLRVKRKENLLTRNYLHLYQKLNDRFSNKFYLLPQVVNFIACLFALYLIKDLQLNNLIILILFSFITITVYKFFLNLTSLRP